MRATLLCLVLGACGGGSKATDGNPDDDAGTIDAPTVDPTCNAPETFADGKTPSRTLHVAAGAGGGGDGSPGNPFGSIEQAAQAATPGTQILLGPGMHASDQFVSALHGTEVAPIWIGGAPNMPKPIISGGAQAIQLQRARYVVVHDLEIGNVTANGMNIDDGGMLADETAAHHVLVQNVYIHDVGTPTGNNDCLKVSGINSLYIYDSRFQNCGGGGSGIDHVGCHGSVVARNTFEGRMGNAVQSKGGARDHDIRQNRVNVTASRAFNLGGSTDLNLFRPPLSMSSPNAEARRIRVYNNLITGLGNQATPFAFVGCIDCLAAHNFSRGQQRWHVRILQETPTQGGYTFEPSGMSRVANNVFVFSAATLATAVNVGGNTAPDTFTFAHNLWYASDVPGQSAPMLPTAETNGVSGTMPSTTVPDDPRAVLTDPCARAPEMRAAMPVTEVVGTFDGACRPALPSIGPFEPCPPI